MTENFLTLFSNITLYTQEQNNKEQNELQSNNNKYNLDLKELKRR